MLFVLQVQMYFFFIYSKYVFSILPNSAGVPSKVLTSSNQICMNNFTFSARNCSEFQCFLVGEFSVLFRNNIFLISMRYLASFLLFRHSATCCFHVQCNILNIPFFEMPKPRLLQHLLEKLLSFCLLIKRRTPKTSIIANNKFLTRTAEEQNIVSIKSGRSPFTLQPYFL